jgi:NTP pyrophosphatase (non-canonical NTP hydrolase)
VDILPNLPKGAIDMRKQQQLIFEHIAEERERQDSKHPLPHGFKYVDRLAILVEEVGEVGKAIFEDNRLELRDELIQVAAVAVRWIEQIDNEAVAEMRKETDSMTQPSEQYGFDCMKCGKQISPLTQEIYKKVYEGRDKCLSCRPPQPNEQLIETIEKALAHRHTSSLWNETYNADSEVWLRALLEENKRLNEVIKARVAERYDEHLRDADETVEKLTDENKRLCEELGRCTLLIQQKREELELKESEYQSVVSRHGDMAREYRKLKLNL